jgi:hypothetical protein
MLRKEFLFHLKLFKNFARGDYDAIFDMQAKESGNLRLFTKYFFLVAHNTIIECSLYMKQTHRVLSSLLDCCWWISRRWFCLFNCFSVVFFVTFQVFSLAWMFTSLFNLFLLFVFVTFWVFLCDLNIMRYLSTLWLCVNFLSYVEISCRTTLYKIFVDLFYVFKFIWSVLIIIFICCHYWVFIAFKNAQFRRDLFF